MKKAPFQISGYRFNKINIDFTSHNQEEPIEIEFSPKGTYFTDKALYQLTFSFIAKCESSSANFAEITCEGDFQFEEGLKFEDIPKYFYVNSIAILFPYVRAFISIVTLQTNQSPLILPTLNLSSLESELIKNTETKN